MRVPGRLIQSLVMSYQLLGVHCEISVMRVWGRGNGVLASFQGSDFGDIFNEGMMDASDAASRVFVGG